MSEDKIRPLYTVPNQPKPGRPRKVKLPPLPEEIMDGMTEIEREHFEFFVQEVKAEHPDLMGTDLIYLNIAAMNYVNVLRSKESELRRRELLGITKTNPETQMLRWIDSLSISRKQRNPGKSAETQERENWQGFFDRKEG